jgi:hypothetical protein
MKRRRAALVGRVRIRPVIEQDFDHGQTPRAHGLMKRRDRVTVPGIDGRASLDEQRATRADFAASARRRFATR